MKIIKYFIIIFSLFLTNTIASSPEDFNKWLKLFEKKAIKKGVSRKTFSMVMKNVRYLPKVIEYDRYQPEFYEDTKTYISKRTNKDKIKNGIKIYKKNKNEINLIDKKFSVEKELLIALMGIETNFGTYLGKMDIISSLATLSYDKRRSEFFTKELITVLQLVDKNIINHNSLYGSWAGAYGNFQFMPSTIKNYAIDYNSNNQIELKDTEESFASAANYINKIGWQKNAPCFLKVNLKNDIPNKYLNTSAKSLNNKKRLSFFKKYIIDYEKINLDKKLIAAIVTPDKDIIKDADTLSPAYLVFSNYELILKWNRSLRFALAVCTLKDKLSNEL
tara:strand:- start:9801 stop:10799 length:999 start_codon:yes stop_codon:yes gene_type:complete